ncbi:hypothetical protein [Chryseobacterium koreense]|nr:hypothetical protein [Chryseobacterium koreense]MBB5333138.1 hypothetical protein [Chryseobacterium koreense]
MFCERDCSGNPAVAKAFGMARGIAAKSPTRGVGKAVERDSPKITT